MSLYDLGIQQALMKFAAFDGEDDAMFKRWSRLYKRRPDLLKKHLRESPSRSVGWKETRLSDS